MTILLGPDPVALWLGLVFVGSGSALLGALIMLAVCTWRVRDSNLD